jgi:hypothetical protein
VFLCFCVFCLFGVELLFFWSFVCFWFCKWSKSSHLWANCKVSNIPFDGWYGRLLSIILASRWMLRIILIDI